MRSTFAKVCAVCIGSATLLGACVQMSVVSDLPARPSIPLPIDVRVEPCVDRTETRGRDLALEATVAFEKELRSTKEFVVRDEARFRLACDVSGFVEGSSIKRWLLPGWGATVGQVSAMLTDTTTGEVIIIARGNATVSGGGLYTVGAETYIVASAVEDVVRQLRAWASGESLDAADQQGHAGERK